MKPYIIEGGKHTDYRGRFSFVNDFDFSNIKRFYILENSEEAKVRGWHVHKHDVKHFYCIKGSFEIAFVKIDNWDNPSVNLDVKSIILSELTSQILVIPAGYAFAIHSLIETSKLLNFSLLSLDETKDETIRYELNTWPYFDLTVNKSNSI